MILEKLSKEKLIEALHKPIMECSEEEIRFVFHIFGFNLKEACFNDDIGMNFEVHYKRVYIVRVVCTLSHLLSFENEYIDFGDKTHGISMGHTETLAETMVVFINMFTPNLLQSAGYQIKYDPANSLFESLEEAQDYLKTIQEEAQKIISVNHPDPVPAPTPKKENPDEATN